MDIDGTSPKMSGEIYTEWLNVFNELSGESSF